MSVIAVLGASGRTGKVLVQEAVKRGHTVQALVRKTSLAKDFPQSVKVFEGDATELSGLQSVMDGAEFVVGLLGPTKGSSPELKVLSTQLVLSLMRRFQVKRFLRMASAPFGVNGEGDEPSGNQKFVAGMMKLMMGAAVFDDLKAAEELRASSVDWTIVRAALLTNAPYPGRYVVGSLNKNSGKSVSRASVVQFILDEIERGQYIRKSPLVTD